jgi:hypothetical protein
MGLNEDLFGFIFESAQKQKKRIKSEDEFKKKIRGLSHSFEDAVSEMISDLVLDNIDYLADIIIGNDPHALAARNADVLHMMLNNQKARGIIEGAKKQKRYVKWDTRKILEAIIIVLGDKGISFNQDELRWLATNIHNIGLYIYKK